MRITKLLVIAWLLPLLGGCLSTELVRWAGDPLTPGEPAGIQRTRDADYVMFTFVTDKDTTERWSFRVPHDWKQLPRSTWGNDTDAEVHGLRDPIECMNQKIPRGSKQKIRYLDHRLTLGRAVVRGGRHPFYGESRWRDRGAFVGVDYDATEYALVRYVDRGPEGRFEIHELYGYDTAEYRWIRIGSVDLGRQRANIPARITATVLFLPALLLDLVGMIIGALASESGQEGVGIPIGIFRRVPPNPVPFSARGIPALDADAPRSRDPVRPGPVR